ncbi:hypothetical protein HZB08_01955, partial [Candidatus Saganbacteria bacterium]|nr:hypothetical protein [Candidatus Saganbacteria bacterium]
MDKKTKKQRFYSFMIVPHDARGRPVSFKISAGWVYAAVSLALFAFLLVGSSVLYSTIVSRKLINYADTLLKNKEQQKEISSFSIKASEVSRAIDELVKKDNELRGLLGLKGWRSKLKLSSDPPAPKESRSPFGTGRAGKVSPEVKSNDALHEFSLADVRIAERKKSLAELKEWVGVVRSRFVSTPSTWPIYGRIVSFFGYRSYPWRGMHTGVDIQAYRGAPVRATAAGVVT